MLQVLLTETERRHNALPEAEEFDMDSEENIVAQKCQSISSFLGNVKQTVHLLPNEETDSFGSSFSLSLETTSSLSSGYRGSSPSTWPLSASASLFFFSNSY